MAIILSTSRQGIPQGKQMEVIDTQYGKVRHAAVQIPNDCHIIPGDILHITVVDNGETDEKI